MEWLPYVIRAVIMFLVVWAAIRIIGNKAISEMTSFDLAGVIMLTTVGAEPVVSKITAKAGLGVTVLTVMTLLMGWAVLSGRFRWLRTDPQVLVENGKVNEKRLRKSRMSIPLLRSHLRLKGYPNIQDVEFAVLEPTGKMSVIPKSQARPVQPKDLGIETQYEGLSLPLVIAGEIQYNNLKYAGLDQTWLETELAKLQAGDIKKLSLVEIDSSGNLYFNPFQVGPGPYDNVDV